MLRHYSAVDGPGDVAYDLKTLLDPRNHATSISFGRNSHHTVILESEAMPLLASRDHAKIKLRQSNRISELILKDQGSTNGTWLNERRVGTPGTAGQVQLREGDIICFGGPLTVQADNRQHPNPFAFQLQGLDQLFAAAAVAVGPSAHLASTAEHGPELGVGEEPVDLEAPSRQREPMGLGEVIDLTEDEAVRHSEQELLPAGRQVGEDDLVEVAVAEDRDHQNPRKRARTGEGPERQKASTAQEDCHSRSAGGMCSALEGQFECTICRDWMVACHSLVPCGHMFCGQCLGDWLPRNQTCPTCRKAGTAPPVRSLAVDNLLAEVVERSLSRESRENRKERQAWWDKHKAFVEARWKSVLARAGGVHGDHGAVGHAMRAHQLGQRLSDLLAGPYTAFGDPFLAAPQHPAAATADHLALDAGGPLSYEVRLRLAGLRHGIDVNNELATNREGLPYWAAAERAPELPTLVPRQARSARLVQRFAPPDWNLPPAPPVNANAARVQRQPSGPRSPAGRSGRAQPRR